MAKKSDDEPAVADSPESEQSAPPELEQTHDTLPEPESPITQPAKTLRAKSKNPWHWVMDHKKVSIPLVIVVVLAVLGGIPFTRYALVGMVWKQQFTVVVNDAQTHKPIPSAAVSLRGHSAITDNQGKARMKVQAGPSKLTVSKKYYTSVSSTVTVPILKQKTAKTVDLKATGRQVPVVVIDTISGKPLANATVSAVDTESKTDKDGKVTMVLPADKTTVSVKLSASGYNDGTATIKVTEQVDKANTFKLTPSGKVYFLSNQSGTIDVVKTNLDGTGREVVLAGTGKENKQDTSLLASRDWKFLVLKAIRDDSGKAKVFLIDTGTGKLTTVDEGDATFTLIGWYGHTFAYEVNRNSVQYYQTGHQVAKSYNADTSKLTQLDQTLANNQQNNAQYDQFGSYYILPNKLVYTVSGYGTGNQSAIRGIQLDGKGKKDYFTVSNPSIASTTYGPNDILYRTYDFNASSTPYKYYELEDETFKEITDAGAGQQFGNQYPTYLFSPDDKQTFWSDLRDGKNSLFVGDAEGKNPKTLASLSEYSAYGWYTNSYVLVSKKDSELYIMPSSGLPKDAQPLKLSDYYKPPVTYRGYGYGYGGQ